MKGGGTVCQHAVADGGFKRGRKSRKSRNIKYVERGRVLFLRADPGWEAELKKANRGKVGAPLPVRRGPRRAPDGLPCRASRPAAARAQAVAAPR